MRLEFQNSVFKEGLNTTVRKGTKWHNKQADNYTIIHTKIKRFRDIVRSDIKHEHDPQCRTYKGLLTVMKKVYKGFTSNHIVTIVDFME